MPDSSQIQEDADKSLTEEDLRFLARRHAILVRKFRARRERERNAQEQQAAAYSLARQFAAMISASAQQAAFSARRGRGGGVPAEENRVGGNAGDGRSRAGKQAEDARYPIFAEDFATRHFEARAETALGRFLRKIGGGGLAASLVFHAGLIFFAIFWVVSVYVAPKEPPPAFFATGSGGGRGGDRPSYADVQASRRSRAGKIAAGSREHKIVSSARTAKLVLPDLPALARPSPLAGTVSAGTLNGLDAGALSSGSVGGLGGGVGMGTGVGIGNARSFVGKFKTTQKILGTAVTASRLAVYMDCSPSMTEVIPVVRKDILKKFPTADVYEFFGCGVSRIEEVVRRKIDAQRWERRKGQLLKVFDREKTKTAGGRSARKKTFPRKKTRKKNGFSFEDEDDSVWRENLSEFGSALLGEWGGTADFSAMDLGGWLNMTLTEGGYDAMIVFADFQDYRDGALDGEAEVLERWLRLAREHGQRLYFFTTEMMPQRIFRRLALHSGGDIALPKEVSKKSQSAEQTARELRKMKRDARVSVADDSSMLVVAAGTEENGFAGTGEDFGEDDVPADADDDAGADDDEPDVGFQAGVPALTGMSQTIAV